MWKQGVANSLVWPCPVPDNHSLSFYFLVRDSLLHVHVVHMYTHIVLPCSAREENRMSPLMLVFMCLSISYLSASHVCKCIYRSICAYIYLYICKHIYVSIHACFCLWRIYDQHHYWLDLGNGAAPAPTFSGCWIQLDSPNRWRLLSAHGYTYLCIKP